MSSLERSVWLGYALNKKAAQSRTAQVKRIGETSSSVLQPPLISVNHIRVPYARIVLAVPAGLSCQTRI